MLYKISYIKCSIICQKYCYMSLGRTRIHRGSPSTRHQGRQGNHALAHTARVVAAAHGRSCYRDDIVVSNGVG